MSERPVPAPDPSSAAYWEACARHVLTLPKCSQCQEFTLPPRVTCPNCHSDQPNYVFEPVKGGGKIRTWTVVRQSFLSGMEGPFVLVDVQLDSQPHIRMIGRLLDGPDAPLSIGDLVSVDFEDIAPGVAVPAFKKAGGQ